MSFWNKLAKPIIGLAPMDGVSDCAYREIQAKYGRPDVIFTEFIAVEGIVRMSKKLLEDFWYTSSQRPIVAQIYGNNPAHFYFAAQLACELGFDGLDINMGCPAKSVVHSGSGAALIRTPKLAQEILLTTKQGVSDWVKSGINWSSWPVISATEAEEKYSEFVESSQIKGIYSDYNKNFTGMRKHIPVSVKTRIGFTEEVVSAWIPNLLELEPAAITVHGRTLKQMYSGKADWVAIANAVDIRNSFNCQTLILGNGDIDSVNSAKAAVREYGVDGVLIGRGSFGNPWVFQDDNKPPSETKIFKIALEHCRLHERYKHSKAFVQMRKNIAWYTKGMHGGSELRSELMQTNSTTDVEKIFSNYLQI